ncbi:oleate hydratase [Crocosphaera sp. UHCC 0190]|uniref:oleate hydratase n=1 Tax=Crocosphaera sp. UHCC 0190 TaxID=3110246 RepID=UPI002B21DEF8|nr:oleate hydratase [Crocosphaera sp. UHCC 0190]MEA5509420.1 oleate hydratase [Crocosphaera sp. UHCC 0190]
MNKESKAYLLGGGIGSLAAAAFMIRDGGFRGDNIFILEAKPVLGGSLDGIGNPVDGYSMRGGRMFTTDNYECTWDLFKSIPSLNSPGKTVFDETMEFNEQHQSNCLARLVDSRRAIVAVGSMGFSMENRRELLTLSLADEDELGASCITDWLSPEFFETEFWYMWSTTFAFQPWHSAVEFKRYLHRFMLEFSRIETLAGVKRTIYNQYDSLVLPIQSWLAARDVHFILDSQVTDLDHNTEKGKLVVTGIHYQQNGQSKTLPVKDGDFVFLQNGSMTDASSLGSMTNAPKKLTKQDCKSWSVWEKLAAENPDFGNPSAFNSSIAESCWESFTVTLKNPSFFDKITKFSGNEPGTGGLVTFKDSNWLMSIVLAHQPHFANQPADIQVFWGYALFPDKVGNFVPKPMSDCNGEEILQELCGHLRFDFDVVESANCIPCRMPYITSMFMPRLRKDRPLPIPHSSKNLALISQFVEIPNDVVFTVEYSVRAAQIAVYQFLSIDHQIPPISAHDKSLRVEFEALIKAFN